MKPITKKMFALFFTCCFFSFDTKIHAIGKLNLLSPTVRQLFLTKAEETINDGLTLWVDYKAVEEKANNFLLKDSIQIPGKVKDKEPTKLFTEDINSIGRLVCSEIVFIDCNLSDACLDGVFNNYGLVSVKFKGLCKLDRKKIFRNGWDWFNQENFHDVNTWSKLPSRSKIFR